jgi:hypothetical protein
MMTGYEAFCLFQSLKLHFTSDSYDFFKYGGKIKTSLDAFDKRKDKYYYHKLSRRLTSREDLIDFLVANFIEDENVWVGNLLTEESELVYRARQKNIQSLSYTFENDCQKLFREVGNPNEIMYCNSGDYPELLKRTLRKEIQIETLCLLNQIINFLPSWTSKISDSIRWPDYRRKILKYAAFLPKDIVKYKLILRKVIEENEIIH